MFYFCVSQLRDHSGSSGQLRQLIQLVLGREGQYFSLTLAVLRPYRKLYEVAGR